MRSIVVILLVGLIISGCSTRSIPTAETTLNINLSIDDVEVIDKSVHGSGSAFTLFPFYLFSPAYTRATLYAKEDAINSRDASGSDFLLEPKSKTFYLNFIIFDYAHSNIISKGVKFK